jgi:hypothetical protein
MGKTVTPSSWAVSEAAKVVVLALGATVPVISTTGLVVVLPPTTNVPLVVATSSLGRMS